MNTSSGRSGSLIEQKPCSTPGMASRLSACCTARAPLDKYSVADRFAFTPRVCPAAQRHLAVGIPRANDGLDAAGHIDFAQRMALVLECLFQRRAEQTLLQFCRAVAAAEVGQADGGLRVEVPVEHRHQGFAHVLDDLRTTR